MSKIIKQKKDVEKGKIVYDPKKNYQWQVDDKFTLVGTDLQILYHTLRELALTQTGTAPANIVASYEVINKLIIKSVEGGLITEAQ